MSAYMRFTVCYCLFACLSSGFAAELRMERCKPLTVNVGIVSVGLDTYWKQSLGLLDDMKKKEDTFGGKCDTHQVSVSHVGMSDNPVAAKVMISVMKATDLDILFGAWGKEIEHV